MPPDLLGQEQIDARMGWPAGRAERLAGRRKLPHFELPDGSIRFDWRELVALVRRNPAVDGSAAGKAVAGAH